MTPSCHCWSSRRPSTRWSCESSTTYRHRRRLLPNLNTEWAHVFAGRWMPSLLTNDVIPMPKFFSYEKRVESAGCTWRWCCSSAWPWCLSGGQEVPKIRNVASPFYVFDALLTIWCHFMNERTTSCCRPYQTLFSSAVGGSSSLRSTPLLRRSRNACRWRRRWRRSSQWWSGDESGRGAPFLESVYDCLWECFDAFCRISKEFRKILAWFLLQSFVALLWRYYCFDLCQLGLYSGRDDLSRLLANSVMSIKKTPFQRRFLPINCTLIFANLYK